ncbi:MAG TPA: PAS domain-containing protein [Blastocatellia bacterium]|nr:PAS domain-containing protein [Blastocatellia bacterium]
MADDLHSKLANYGLALDPHDDSEACLRLALEAAGMATWDWDIASDVVYHSPRLEPMFGLAPGGVNLSHSVFMDEIHEEDRGRVEQAIEQAFKGEIDYTLEFRVIWPDGSVHWLASRGLVQRNPAGEPERMIGVVMDITERKEAEQLRHHLLNRIVAAQEEERRRVSRELHDQMGQNLAALIVGLESLKSPCASSAPALNRLRWLQELANRLSQEVHSLAWELRPPALDDLGLPMALERYIQQWSAHGDVAIDWHASGFTERRLPSAVETTLYRVVQEALTNVLKHAQATRVSLILRAAADSVLAIIEDNGRGFDADASLRAAAPHYKLGLVGMRERVLLVNGTLNIESLPDHGTTVYVRIPLAEDA